MAEARIRDEWQRTSSLMVLIANTHRDPKRTKPFRPSDFDPFSLDTRPRSLAGGCEAAGSAPRNAASQGFSRPAVSVQVGVEVLKDVFIDGRIPRQGG